MMFEDEDSKGEAKLKGKNRLPETPSLDEEGAYPKRQNPFLLDDFGPGSPANTTKP